MTRVGCECGSDAKLERLAYPRIEENITTQANRRRRCDIDRGKIMNDYLFMRSSGYRFVADDRLFD